MSHVGRCPPTFSWVGPHAPLLGGRFLELPSRVKYHSPHGVLLSLVYGTTASALWLELQGPIAGRPPPSGLCTGSPVTGCFHGFSWRLAWSLLHLRRVPATGLGVPPLLLALCIGLAAPVCATHEVSFVVTCTSVALPALVCAVSMAPWRSFNGARVRCGICLACGLCGVHRPLVLVHRCTR